jgi:hypothetical protein
VQVLGTGTGCRYWVQVLSASNGCRYWVLVRGAGTECRYWVQVLSETTINFKVIGVLAEIRKQHLVNTEKC